MDIIVERILSVMKQKKITDKQLTSDLGINKSAVTDWKTGKTKSFKRYIDQIANYLDVPVDYLLGNIDNPHGIVYTIGEDGKRYVISGLSKEEYELLVAQLEVLRKQQRRREEQD